MRKILLYLGFCLLLFSSFPVNAAEVEPLKGEALITSNKLNVRSGPSKEYDILGTLNRDQVVEVTGIVEPDWFVIDFNNNQGYIYGEYLVFTPEEETGTISVIPMKNYLILGLGAIILLVVVVIVYTLISFWKSREEETEEEIIPLTVHDDTNMHLGEVTYDTYRLDIDPSFFETTTLLTQPESFVGDNEDAVEHTTDIQMIDTRLEQASAQLAALQKEVEELKKQKQED